MLPMIRLNVSKNTLSVCKRNFRCATKFSLCSTLRDTNSDRVFIISQSSDLCRRIRFEEKSKSSQISLVRLEHKVLLSESALYKLMENNGRVLVSICKMDVHVHCLPGLLECRHHIHSGSAGAAEWRDVVSEAERVVGYPTSFLNLRWLFNDEIANTAIHLRKLVGTNHPLLKSAKNLLMGSKSNLQSVGLIILLVSKAAGFNAQDFTRDQYDSGVLHAQRALAEIVEMKRTGHMIHKTMANLQEKEKIGNKFKDLLYGNKIVLLTGDYLLATCLRQLGGLRNNEVTELVSTGLRDLVEGDFLGEHDAENNPMPTKPKASNDVKSHYEWESEDNLNKLGSNEYLGQGRDEWILRTMLTSGSILGKGCQGAMKIAKRGEQMERDAYILGGHLALLWQLYLDVKDFFTHPYSYSLVGAPVILAMWEYPSVYGHIWEAKVEKKPIELKQLHYAVRSTRAMDYLTKFLDEELETIMKYTEKFPGYEARSALQKMAHTIHGEALQYIE